MSEKDKLPPQLVDQILDRLGLARPPATDLGGLTEIYRAWCRKVPFDNIKKRIHLAANDPAPLPGERDAEFFRSWLQSGVGGTCWAGNGALHSLLGALGFCAELATATMLTDTEQPPNHGTVVIHLATRRFLVDASMLHDRPLPLQSGGSTAIDHPAWGLSCRPADTSWIIAWRPLHMLAGCNCRLEDLSVSRQTFRRYNEVTRTKSPFNDNLAIRCNTARGVDGIFGSWRIRLSETGAIISTRLSARQRVDLLVEKFGIAEEIVQQIPADRSTAEG
ncbi:MAG: arylamine N-acetyltransferase [Desulfopila sp.]